MDPSQSTFSRLLAGLNAKTDEVPVARKLFSRLDLVGRTVSMDALHTQGQTARELVLEHGAHHVLTVKDNQSTLRKNIEAAMPAPPAGFSPSAPHSHPGPADRDEQGSS